MTARKGPPRVAWRRVNDETKVKTEDGEPVLVKSRARNLDRAFDDACQEFEETLRAGGWNESEDQEGTPPEMGDPDGLGRRLIPVWWELPVERWPKEDE